MFDPFNDVQQCYYINPPIDFDFKDFVYIGVFQGRFRIYYHLIHRHNVCVWELEDDGNAGTWCLIHKVYFKDMVSGALLKSVVDRAKDSAIKRAIADPKGYTGVSMEDLTSAATQEYKENEIFPKSDTMEDWLQLLDYAPENVASVKPIGRHRGEELARKAVI